MEDFATELRRTVTRDDFKELKEIVAYLALAQKRTEQKVEELAEAQKLTEVTMREQFEDIHRRFGVLGSRWGDGAEEAFRQGLLEHVRHLGHSVERYRGKAPGGFINGRPGRTYDLDILTHNGLTVATEIKSNTSGADVTEFARSVELFERQTGRKVNRRILMAVVIQMRAFALAGEHGVTVSTSFSELERPQERV